ncbi:MAG TPA: hypothetical protein VEU96_02025 [Bryobacteraceae bacterium]|nr:hypothetical protein [Bryobacteraceae bacterium]
MPNEFRCSAGAAPRTQQLYLQAWFEKWRKKNAKSESVPTSSN